MLIPLGVLLASAPGFLTGPQTGVMAVLCAGAMAVCLHYGTGKHQAMAVAAAVTVLGAALPIDPAPVFMSMSSRDIEPVMQLYSEMGIEDSTIREVMATMEYLAPGIGALQISLGCMAAVLFAASVRGGGFAGSGRFSLAWQMSWVLIVCLTARVFSGGMPPAVVRIADNVLLFMALPYLIEGGAVVLRWASPYPGMTVVLSIALVLLTPMMLMAVALTGVLDTWFDFRRRLDMKVERLDK